MKTSHLFAAIAGFATILFIAPRMPVHAQTKWAVVMSGLDNPRGLTFVPVDDSWALYVAESGTGGSGPCATVRGAMQCAGTTGAVSRLQDGVQQRIVTGGSDRAKLAAWRSPA